jgi:DNA-binding NtrC family response regulator
MQNDGRILVADDGWRAGPLPAQGDKGSAPQEAVMLNDARILVVDDEWWIRAFVRVDLEEAGFAVAEAQDAEAALAALDAVPVQVLVTDLDLGGGPDGLALAAAAKRRCPDLRVVYVSGDPDRFRQRALAGWERFVPKPFPIGTVVRAVSEMAALDAGERAMPGLWAAKRLDWLPPPGASPPHRAA